MRNEFFEKINEEYKTFFLLPYSLKSYDISCTKLLYSEGIQLKNNTDQLQNIFSKGEHCFFFKLSFINNLSFMFLALSFFKLYWGSPPTIAQNGNHDLWHIKISYWKTTMKLGMNTLAGQIKFHRTTNFFFHSATLSSSGLWTGLEFTWKAIRWRVDCTTAAYIKSQNNCWSFKTYNNIPLKLSLVLWKKLEESLETREILVCKSISGTKPLTRDKSTSSGRG